MNVQDLRKKDIWNGEHKKFTFEIVNWDFKSPVPPFVSCWNYYIYFHESKYPRFNELWLEDKIFQFSPDSPKRITHDYYSLFINSVDWHGGITYYSKECNIPGQRCVKIGVDYLHLHDTEHGEYLLEEVLQDCIKTIDEITELN